MMDKTLCRWMVVLACAGWGSATNAALITLDSGSARGAVAQEDSDQVTTYSNAALTLDSKDSYTATVNDVFAEITNDWQSSLTSQLFKWDVNHAVGTVFRSVSFTTQEVYFTPTENINYQISGSYDMTGNLGTYMGVFIHDLLTPSNNQEDYLFFNFQSSQNTINESFVAGGVGGDLDNRLFGNLSGTLSAFHNYRFGVVTWLDNCEANASGSSCLGPFEEPVLTTASGSFSLLLGDTNQVPTPATVALFSIGLAGLGWSRRKKA